jgi:site-specific DNA recombinase
MQGVYRVNTRSIDSTLVHDAEQDGMRVAIYARLSKDTSGVSENVEIQIQETKAYARSMGYRIAGIFSDNDISASKYSKKPRPGYQTLLGVPARQPYRGARDGPARVRAGEETLLYGDPLAAIRRNGIEAILITEMPRLYRRMEELLEVIRLAEQTELKQIIALDEAGYDLSTGQGIHNAISAVNNAMLESRRLSDRQKRRIRAKAATGASHGGRRCFGYEPGGKVLRESEAEIIRWMVKRILSGGTINSIVRELNDRGVKTVGGRKWEHVLVKQLLESPRIARIRAHGELRYPGNFPAIIAIEDWELLQFALERLRRRFPGGVQLEGRRYLLTGLIYCGVCERPMSGHAHRGGNSLRVKRRYACHKIRSGAVTEACGKVYRMAEALETFVIEATLDLVERSGLPVVVDPHVQDAKLLLQQYQKLRSRRSDLRRDYATGLLESEEYAEARAMLESEIEDVQAKLSRVQPDGASASLIPPGKSVREAWDEGSFWWRRMFLARAISQVIVKPHPRRGARWRDFVFDEDGIDIIWRG